MTDSQVQIKIPEDLVKGIVQAEIIKQMGNQEQMIRAVVEAAMNTKARDSYGRETVFQEEFKNQINEMAKEMFRAWVKENTEKIRAAVHANLTRGQGKRIKELADQFTNKLTVGAHVNINLTLGD